MMLLQVKSADVTEVKSDAMSSTVQLRLETPKRSDVPDLNAPFARAAITCAGLFAGIGGIELGFSRAGHSTTLLCEIDSAANAILDEHFQGVRRASDIRKLDDFGKDAEIVTAGFPCQDLSQAGRTAGIHGTRSGLIAEVLRLVEHRRVPWLLLENVPFMLQLGKGRALDYIVTAIERLGYRWAYRIVNSRAFGVPQRRERVYLLASLVSDPRDVLLVDDTCEPLDGRSFRETACGFYWTEGSRGLGWAVDSVPTLKGGSTIGIPSPPAIIFPSGRIAKPDIRDAERMQGFAADWTRPAESSVKRSMRWKVVGNAVTVQAAEWIGKRIRNPGRYDPEGDHRLQSSQRWPSAAWNIGDGRHTAAVSAWPTYIQQSLESFLSYECMDLSSKATAGFLSRARSAKLRFPDGFLAAVQAHLDVVNGRSDVRSSESEAEAEAIAVSAI